jgi:hypothetical protein
MRDVHAAIDWALGKNPLVGNCVGGSHYVFKTAPMGSTPSFRVFYRYNHNKEIVYLLSIAPIIENDR